MFAPAVVWSGWWLEFRVYEAHQTAFHEQEELSLY